MQFSQVDVISRENEIRRNRKEYETKKWYQRALNNLWEPRNPRHKFSFAIKNHLYLSASIFCEDVAQELERGAFSVPDLVEALYKDFLTFYRRTNDIHGTYKRLKARDLTPATVTPYRNEEPGDGNIFEEEARGLELLEVRLDHKDALRGELILRAMTEVYEHTYTLENVLEIVACDFIDDYRRGYITNPIDKVLHYLN